MEASAQTRVALIRYMLITAGIFFFIQSTARFVLPL